MAQLARPYQIALAAVALLGLVWALALRGHTSGSNGSTAPAPAQAPAKPTPIYHGAAPGVEGLTRAIAKAHGAVAASQQNATQLQQRSREASGEAAAGPQRGQAHAGATPSARSAAHATVRPHSPARVRKTTAPAQSGRGAASKHTSDNRPAAQVAVEREVAQGKTVLLLFWNSKSSVDHEVRTETQAMVASAKGRLALHVAAPNQVGEFGSVTEVAHVYQTPTILIVNRRGVVSTLTGLTDTFALKQLVHEAQRANG